MLTLFAALWIALASRFYQLVPHRAGPGDGGVAMWSAKQIDLIRQQICPGATDDELAFFAQVCRHRQLDPFAGEIVGIMRWDKRAGREVMKIQTTVEGYRTIAMRTGLYAGQDEILWCGPDGTWRDIWPDPASPPYAAKTIVYRVDVDRPFPGKAHYHEFVQLDKDRRPTAMWQKMPANQLGKCAERQALIRAFKRELRAAGIPTEELSGPSRVSMEARQVGLDDDGRHALVAEVTEGRTESTRDLTPDETLAVRAEIAARRPAVQRTAAGPGGTETYWVDPVTGEIVDPPETISSGAPPMPPEPGDTQEVNRAAVADGDPGPEPEGIPTPPAPAGNPGYVGTTGRVHVPDDAPLTEEPRLDAAEADRRRLVAELVPRAKALTPEARSLLHVWLDAHGIGSAKLVRDYTLDELRRTAEAITEFEKPLDEEPF